MSDQAQAQCRNIWHQRPGALLKCPHCNMSISDLKESGALRDLRSAVAAGNGAPVAQERRILARPQPPRLNVKHFKGPDVARVVIEANEWANKISGDERIEVRNIESMFGPDGSFNMLVYTMIVT